MARQPTDGGDPAYHCELQLRLVSSEYADPYNTHRSPARITPQHDARGHRLVLLLMPIVSLARGQGTTQVPASLVPAECQPIQGPVARPGRRAGRWRQIWSFSAILALSRRPSTGHSEPMEPTRAPARCLRRPVPEDRQALNAMIGRCSPETIRQRFHGRRNSFPEAYLTSALGGLDGHFALIAEVAGGSLVALASCVARADDAAEIAVLVEDSYQRQGIGSTMLRILIAHADHRDISNLQATVLAEQEWILLFMRSFGSCSATVRMGVFDMTLRREKGRPA
jgi:GNAT superfamily N-acetyltransferase